MKFHITTKQIALIAIFAALYSVVRLVPMGPMIGLSGTFLSCRLFGASLRNNFRTAHRWGKHNHWHVLINGFWKTSYFYGVGFSSSVRERSCHRLSCEKEMDSSVVLKRFTFSNLYRQPFDNSVLHHTHWRFNHYSSLLLAAHRSISSSHFTIGI